MPVFRFSFTHKSVSCNINNPVITFCFRHKDKDSDVDQLSGSDSPSSDEDDSFARSFLPDSQEETQVHSNKKSKHHSSGNPHKRHKHHSKNHSNSHRGVLTDIAAQNRHNRRLENSANMSESAGKRGKDKDLKKQLEAEIAKLQAQIQENQQAHEQELAEARTAALKGKKRKSRAHGYGVQVPISTELEERVIDVAGTELWRTCKFLADESQLLEACQFIMETLPETSDLVDDKNPEKDLNIEAFSAHYGEKVCKTINTKRSDVQSGMKKAYEIRVSSGLSVPTPKQLGQVIRRVGLEYDPENPEKNAENREWFLWYWEHLLSKVGGKNVWGHTIRCYGTISQHAPPDDPNRKYITSSDEALVLVMYENCGQRFPYTAECNRKGIKVDQNHKRYQSRWSDNRAGQCKWGGWNLNGRKRYIELRTKISKAKRKNHVAAVEAHCLSELQAKHSIGTSRTSKKKGKKAKDFEGNEESFASFGVESDEELEEEEEEVPSDFEELEDDYRAPPPKAARHS